MQDMLRLEAKATISEPFLKLPPVTNGLVHIGNRPPRAGELRQ